LIAVFVRVALLSGPIGALGADGEAGFDRETPFPAKYLIDYPAAEQFCPPLETFFEEVVQTVGEVRGRRFTHQPNGGYGLPVVQQVEGKNLLHLGADVGWYRVNAPVYAVAAGVVRLSRGPIPPIASESKSTGERSRASGARVSWGNYIVLEHRLLTGEYVTTVYGHLGANRLVKAGQIVQAGRQIGAIGAKNVSINGGYNPHLHFGVRQGRLAENGCTLLLLRWPDGTAPLKLLQVGEDEIEVELPEGIKIRDIEVAGRKFPISVREGKTFAPAAMLWTLGGRAGFNIVGYGLTTEGWTDPVAFLRQMGAASNPAPFVRAKAVPRTRGKTGNLD